MYFVLLLYSKIWPKLAALEDARVQNLSHFEFGLSSAFKVKHYVAVGLPIHDCLLLLDCNLRASIELCAVPESKRHNMGLREGLLLLTRHNINDMATETM